MPAPNIRPLKSSHTRRGHPKLKEDVGRKWVDQSTWDVFFTLSMNTFAQRVAERLSRSTAACSGALKITFPLGIPISAQSGGTVASDFCTMIPLIVPFHMRWEKLSWLLLHQALRMLLLNQLQTSRPCGRPRRRSGLSWYLLDALSSLMFKRFRHSRHSCSILCSFSPRGPDSRRSSSKSLNTSLPLSIVCELTTLLWGRLSPESPGTTCGDCLFSQSDTMIQVRMFANGPKSS